LNFEIYSKEMGDQQKLIANTFSAKYKTHKIAIHMLAGLLSGEWGSIMPPPPLENF